MNAALNRPALNATILVSVIFHLAVLYYLAMSWQILPTIVPPAPQEPTIRVEIPQPPPPVLKPDVEKPPVFNPHRPDAPIVSPVPPVPLPPNQADPDAPRGPLTLDHTIPEQPLSQVSPTYPIIALNAEKEGHVRLSITILEDGSVTDVEVVSANPSGYFERSAVDAVRKWHYKPSGSVRRRVYVDIDYVLRG
jgi:periplasmic protein TonB